MTPALRCSAEPISGDCSALAPRLQCHPRARKYQRDKQRLRTLKIGCFRFLRAGSKKRIHSRRNQRIDRTKTTSLAGRTRRSTHATNRCSVDQRSTQCGLRVARKAAALAAGNLRLRASGNGGNACCCASLFGSVRLVQLFTGTAISQGLSVKKFKSRDWRFYTIPQRQLLCNKGSILKTHKAVNPQRLPASWATQSLLRQIRHPPPASVR